jgi:putative ABC transport system permease protein
MMLSLSRQTVRQSWPPYVGAFVALGFGITLIATAVTLAAAVDGTSHQPGVTADQRAALDDLASMVGIMSAIALFMAMFVVASTFGFVVAARRRELGLLRLVGATPGQVRRMVLGESAVVAVLATVAGCLLATAAGPAFAALLEARGVVAVSLEMPAPWLSWAVAAPCGAGVALLGSWRASRRASRVSPVAALREAGLERRRPSVWQLLVGTTCLLGSAAVLLVAREISPLFALVVSVLLPEVVVVGLVCFGGVLFPWLAGLLARPFARRNVSARLARDHVRTAVRTPAAIAAPILAISAIAGSLVVALSFTADWTTAMDRAQLHAPLVVETNGDREAVARLTGDPAIAVADPRTTLTVGLGPEGDREEVEVVDVVAAEKARGLTAVRGSLSRVRGEHVAVTETYTLDSGTGLGDRVRIRVGGRTIRPTVAAVVRDAPDLYADVLLPRSLVARQVADVVPDPVFVDPGDADVPALLAGTDARVLTSAAWIDEVDARTRASNEIGLWVLLGPAGLYAGIAIVNSVLIGASQRRRQLRTIGLLGATEDQLRRMAVWEAGSIGAAALLVGGAVVGFVGWLIRYATTRHVPDVALTIPWLPLTAIAVTCIGLAMVAALTGARISAKRLTNNM